MPPTTTVAALVAELRLNSAEFRAEMDGARKKIGETGIVAGASSRQIAKLASEGFGAVIPISFRAERGIERFIESALKGQGALATLGKATLLLGAALAAFEVGKLVTEFAALGTTAKKYEENIKKAAEEQAKFLEGISRQSGLLRGLRADLAELGGDPLAQLRKAQTEREDEIRRAFPTDNPGRQAALGLARQVAVAQERKALDDLRKVRDDNDQKLLDQILKERDVQIKAWGDETRVLVDQLQARLKLRQDFEAQLGQGGLGGEGVATGFAAVRDLRNQLTKDLRDLAFVQREGVPGLDVDAEKTAILQKFVTRIDEVRARFQGLPTVIDLVDKELEPLNTNFVAVSGEFEKARGFIAAFVPSADELQTRLGGIAERFATMPQATEAAAQAIRELSRDYNDLSSAIFGATLQLFQFNQAAAG
jgi:hypothetical protein